MLVILAEWAQIAIGNCRLFDQSEQVRMGLDRSVMSLEAKDSLASLGVDEIAAQSSLVESVAEHARALIECRSLLLLAPGSGDELVVRPRPVT